MKKCLPTQEHFVITGSARFDAMPGLCPQPRTEPVPLVALLAGTAPVVLKEEQPTTKGRDAKIGTIAGDETALESIIGRKWFD